MELAVSNLQLCTLSACVVAPENARFASQADVAALEASIEVEGLLDPLHGYKRGKAVMIWDGGRRLRALQALDVTDRLPLDIKTAGVPVIVSDRATARRRSLVTFVREALHPAQEFRAYKALFDTGQDPGSIAASLGIDARRVAQLLKLSNLAPDILAAFEAGDFSLDVAEAFTLTDDAEKQLAALAACTGWINAGRIRQLLRTGTFTARDRLARFVGREAYAAAGGGFVWDLFTTDRDGELWNNSGLVERLAAAKLAAAVESIRAEGWAWVTVIEPHDYAWSIGYERIAIPPVDLGHDDQVSYDDAVSRLEDPDTEPFAYDQASATIERLTAKMESGEIGEAQRAMAGVFVQVDGGGELSIRRGYVRAAAKVEVDARKAAVAADPASFGWGHTGHWHMTHVATAAVRHAVFKDPAAAYDILVASLAWHIVGGSPGSTPALKLEPRGINPVAIPTDARVSGEGDWQEARAAWRDRLPAATFTECFEFVVALPPQDKAQLLALGVSLAFDAVELRFDQRRPGAWEQLGIFARHAGLAMTQAWTPDATFLRKGSKDALLSALTETGGADAYAKAKKNELVAALVSRTQQRSWLPKLLQGLGRSEPEQEAPMAAE
jgi:ParB family chromosome partitioning protein